MVDVGQHTDSLLVHQKGQAAAEAAEDNIDADADAAVTAAATADSTDHLVQRHSLEQLYGVRGQQIHIHSWHRLLVGEGQRKAKEALVQQAAAVDHMLAAVRPAPVDCALNRDSCASSVAAILAETLITVKLTETASMRPCKGGAAQAVR